MRSKKRQKHYKRQKGRKITANKRADTIRGDYDEAFQNSVSAVREHLIKYDCDDVCVSLNISDLWLPNIGCQVKHILAFVVAAGTSKNSYSGARKLSTYDEFVAFIEELYALLPDFPSLEDYVPERDWGSVKFCWDGIQVPLFYGASLERVPDFVEAYRLLYEGNAAALMDMKAALLLQAHIINSVDSNLVGDADNAAPGKLVVPSSAFWTACGAAIRSTDASLRAAVSVSIGLQKEIGAVLPPTKFAAFADAVMTGKALPLILLEVDGYRYPWSARAATSAVIDHWSQRAKMSAPATAVARFVQDRIDNRNCFAGPFELRTQHTRLPFRFSAAIIASDKFYLFLPITRQQAARLAEVERACGALFTSEEEWGLDFGNGRIIQFRSATGKAPTADNVSVIAVLSEIAAASQAIGFPKTGVRVFWIVDLITVIDALESPEELNRFFEYLDEHAPLTTLSLSGNADMFAAFRDSNAYLVGGARVPSMIWLDPHWGSSWRYRELENFWKNAPRFFPNNQFWKIEPPTDGIQRLISRGTHFLAWTTSINDTSLHFVFDMEDSYLNEISGSILETFVHCLTDAAYQRREILEPLPLFETDRIVTLIRAKEPLDVESASEANSPGTDDRLFDNWRLTDKQHSSVSVEVAANLSLVFSGLKDARDARFEVTCLTEWLNGICGFLGCHLGTVAFARLRDSALRRPRFTLTSRNRKIDAPDFATPIVPSLDAYKLARRELATTLMSAGVTPGTYELASAKSILDQARDSFRSIIHERISKLTQAATLTFCVEQIAALMIENANAAVRAQLSLTHEVSYDRAQAAAEIHDKFAQDSRNYRYMLEACLSMSVSSCEETPTARILNDLLAAIDWLFILYNASDVLHNGIDVGGITIDADYIPEVFYSQLNDEQETEFAREQADARLGINLSEPDRMLAESERLADLERLDLAFEADVGFTFRHLLQTLEVLSCWQRAQNHEELLLSYRSTSEDIVDVLRQSIPDLTQASASALVSFATLEANQVRRLLGRARDEADVPVWDHNKRSSRYTIRPLVPIENDLLVWSAPSAQLAGRIWLNSVTDGYLPADFEWPAVVPIVRSIKERLEALLENRAAEICRRGTSFVEKGIDFKSRFPSESFDDVGDFDVLAYWPASNTWISAECKYNQPPFCLKDARRLRERIFGRPPDRGHFSKIERRREFLNQNRERLRRLLNWPESGAEFKIFELYVSRDIYWWMRNPPFAVSTDFVRIDALDHWLRVRMLITEERDR